MYPKGVGGEAGRGGQEKKKRKRKNVFKRTLYTLTSIVNESHFIILYSHFINDVVSHVNTLNAIIDIFKDLLKS